MTFKKIMIAVSLDEATQKPFHYLRELPIPLDSEIHIVHMATETFFTDGVEFEVRPYPPKEDRTKIVEEVKKKLLKFKEDIFPNHNRIGVHVVFDTNIKAAFTDYATQQKADLVVVATRGRQGMKALFDSSFAQHQLKYSPANVLVLR